MYVNYYCCCCCCCCFSHQRWLMVFYWSLSDSKSPQVSKTFFSVLADLNNAIVWTVSTRLVISKFSSLCINPLVTVPIAPTTIGINVIFMFHSFFNSLARSRYFSLFSHSFNFTLWSAGTAKSTILEVLSFLLIVIRSSHLAKISWSICISKSQSCLCVSFSRTDSGLCMYHFFVWSNWNFLHNSQWITLPTLSYLVLYSFCVSLLHSLINWLVVSSQSPHNLHLLFCCVFSILSLIWFVLMALSWAAVRRDPVSLLRFPFLSHVHVFSCVTSLKTSMFSRVWRRLKCPYSCFTSHFCFLVVSFYWSSYR